MKAYAIYLSCTNRSSRRSHTDVLDRIRRAQADALGGVEMAPNTRALVDLRDAPSRPPRVRPVLRAQRSAQALGSITLELANPYPQSRLKALARAMLCSSLLE